MRKPFGIEMGAIESDDRKRQLVSCVVSCCTDYDVELVACAIVEFNPVLCHVFDVSWDKVNLRLVVRAIFRE